MLDDARELKVTIESRQGTDDAAAQVVTRTLLARFRRLQALLRGEEPPQEEADGLSRDIEAQKRGEMPAFMARKLAAEKAGTSRVLQDTAKGTSKAERMALDRDQMQKRRAKMGPPRRP